MSRVSDLNKFHVQGAVSTTAETVTNYFSVGSRPIMARNHVLTGINPAAANGDTVSSTWAYTVTGAGGASWVTIDTEAAFEYNDTDDTNALGDVGDSTASSVIVGSDINTRIPANALIRHEQVTTGTVTSLQMNAVLEYVVL